MVRTIRNPLAQVAVRPTLRAVCEAAFQPLAEVAKDLVHVRFESQHTAARVVLRDRPLYAGMLGGVRRAEHAEHEFSVDQGGVVAIELRLSRRAMSDLNGGTRGGGDRN